MIRSWQKTIRRRKTQRPRRRQRLFHPNIKHWHGASEHTSMTHIAVQEEINGSAAECMELVSDEQYSGFIQK